MDLITLTFIEMLRIYVYLRIRPPPAGTFTKLG